ncbi:hypothetical protein [Xiashengella succiniciproducens]
MVSLSKRQQELLQFDVL